MSRSELLSHGAMILVALAIWTFAAPAVEKAIFRPVPYDQVELLAAEVRDDRLYFAANFRKIDCEIKRVDAVGTRSGVTDILDWQDEDGFAETYNRSGGLQTLRMSVALTLSDYDFVEIRTVHDCGDQLVLKTFYVFENPDQFKTNPYFLEREE